MATVTVERLERAIRVVAEMMLKHNRPRLKETIHILEAERDRLQNEIDPLEFARSILARKKSAA